MVYIDERKLVDILYEIIAYNDFSGKQISDTIHACLKFLDVYTIENKADLDRQIRELTHQMFSIPMKKDFKSKGE